MLERTVLCFHMYTLRIELKILTLHTIEFVHNSFSSSVDCMEERRNVGDRVKDHVGTLLVFAGEVVCQVEIATKLQRIVSWWWCPWFAYLLNSSQKCRSDIGCRDTSVHIYGVAHWLDLCWHHPRRLVYSKDRCRNGAG